MIKRYALSAIGHDKPGIVAAVTGPLHKHEANIEDSSMSILEDEFAVILIMTMDEHKVSSLKEAIKGVESTTGLTFNIKEIPDLVGEPTEVEPSHVITLHGADAGGLVYRTTELLAENNINITDLQTKRLRGDEGDVYIMILEVVLPDDAPDSSNLEKKLATLAKELGVTIKIAAVEENDPL
jgi:glycine cleavage system transcriptional repressor